MIPLRRIVFLVVFLFTAVILSDCSTGAESPDPVPAGWELLINNRCGEAVESFRSALEENERNSSARRGLLLSLLALGEDNSLLEEIERYRDHISGSSFDYYLIKMIYEFTGMKHRKYYDRMLELSEKLVEKEESSITDRRAYQSWAISMALLAGDRGKIEDYTEELNRIGKWAILGPFDNISGAGSRKFHLKSWGTGIQYIGKFGQRINWFNPELTPLDRIILPTNYFHRKKNTTSYARTVVQIPETGRYLISISYTGDMKFYINSVQLHHGDKHTAGEEILHWEADLTRGPNIFSFKISSREERGSFGCAVSHPDGSEVSDLEIRPMLNPEMTSEEENSRKNLNLQQVPLDFTKEIREMAENNPENPECRIWNLFHTARSSKPAEAIELCEKLYDEFPESGFMKFMIGWAYSEADNTDMANQCMEEAAKLDTSLVEPQLYKAREAISQKRYQKALRIVEPIFDRVPFCRNMLKTRIEALEEIGEWEKIRELARYLETILEDDYFPYNVHASYQEHMANDRKEKEYREKAMDYMSPIRVNLRTFIGAEEEKDYDRMESSVKEFLEINPSEAGLWYIYIRALMGKDDVKEAARQLAKVVESFPQEVDLLVLKSHFAEAGAYLTMDKIVAEEANLPSDPQLQRTAVQNRINRPEAARILEQALNFAPSSFKIRERIRDLRRQKSYRTFFSEYTDQDIYDLAVEPGDYTGESAVVLKDDVRMFVFRGNATMKDHVLAVQVLNEAGVSRLNDYSVGYSSATNDLVFVTCKTLKEDGSKTEAKTMLNKVVFSDLEPGDIIFINYQLTSFVSGRLSGAFWDKNLFPFYHDPCLESSYTLIHPSTLDFDYRAVNCSDYTDLILPVADIAERGLLRKKWIFADLDPSAGEPGATEGLSWLPWLDISTIKSWSRIVNWYLELSMGQTDPTWEVREKAEELTGSCSSEKEIISTILDYVSNEISYQQLPFYQSAFIPREAREVLRDRYGDCKDKCSLMISLLKAAGIDSCYFALTNPDVQEDYRILPSPRFRHAVVCRVLPDGKRQWFDPTVRYGVPDQIPLSLASCPALIIKKGTDSLCNIDETMVREYPYTSRSVVELDREGGALVRNRQEHRLVDYASSRRTRLESMSDRDIREGVIRAISAEYPGATLEEFRVTGKERNDTTLCYEYDYRVPEYCQDSGDFISLKFPWSSNISSRLGAVVSGSSRKSPVNLRNMNILEEEEFEIHLSGARNVSELPEGVDYKFGDCYYRTSYSRCDDGIRGKRVLYITGKRVDLVWYTKFKEFVDNIRRDLRRLHHLRCM